MRSEKLIKKMETIELVLLFVLLSTTGVIAVTRTITPTEDTVFTYIRNTNGYIYDVTLDNLQTAVDNLSNAGMVWVGEDITTSTSLDIDEMVTVDFCGHTIFYAGSSYAVRLRWGARINNIKIDMTGADIGDDVSAIYLDGSDLFHMRHGSVRARSQAGGSNINLISDNQQRTGLYLYSNSSIDDYYVSYTRWDNVRTSYFRYGIRIETWTNGASTCWNNANSFVNCHDVCSNVSVWLHRNTIPNHVICGVEGNMFQNFQCIGSDISQGLFTKNCFLTQGAFTWMDCIISNWGSATIGRKQYYMHDSLGKHQYLNCNGVFSDIDDSEVTGGWSSIYMFKGDGTLYGWHTGLTH
jgi:hypothetical protein